MPMTDALVTLFNRMQEIRTKIAELDRILEDS